MKRYLLFLLLLASFAAAAQKTPFRFAFLSDTHIGSPNGGAEEDLRRSVADINSQTGIDFVVLTGDITELGTNSELLLAKKLLDSLNIQYYIIPGNHDTGWSESGGLSFTQTFGSDKFHFKHKGIHFIGCASGPYVRMSDGHVPRDAVNWMKKELKRIGKNEPVIFLNHYPLDSGLDNWYEIIDLLKTKNTVLALCGHGHNNRLVKAEDIPAVMGRSNLRAKEAEGGYNLVDVQPDSIRFTVRRPQSKKERQWTAVAFVQQQYDATARYPRPDFSINNQYPKAQPVWSYQSAANVLSTPLVLNNQVVFGNGTGELEALDFKTGKKIWRYKTGGPIFSSPAGAMDSGGQKSRIVLGSSDGAVYCISNKGKLIWKTKTGAAVLGAPLVQNNTVYIGGSDGGFRALNIKDGKELWRFSGLKGPVVSTPVIYQNTLIFGAWDQHLYALDSKTGNLLWKWNNGSPIINYSPAACIPVVSDGVVYVVAPDRYLSAIDITTGNTLWRTARATVRESIGLSADKKMVYGKTMQDTVVAFAANRSGPQMQWMMHAGFGYEHAPSMLIEKDNLLYFGTRNGVLYAINPSTQKISWLYKMDNSMVNTVNAMGNGKLVAATMDGKVCLFQVKE